MPIIFDINEVLPGMTLAKNIVYEEKPLLKSGYKLGEHDIKALKRRGIKSVYIFDPLLDEFCDDDSLDHEVSQHVRKALTDSIDNVEKNFKKHSSITMNDVYELKQTISECIDFIKSNPVAVAILNKSSRGNFSKQHSANVMYLSMLVAMKLKNYIIRERMKTVNTKNFDSLGDLNPMGLGAVLIDLKLDKFEDYANRALKPDEVEKILNHCKEGYEELPNELHPYSRAIVKTHHECFNGLGYYGLKNAAIPILSRVIRVADAFDIATSRNLFHEAKSHVYVLFHMTHGKYKTYFDPEITRALSEVIQPFPIGAKVEMANGNQAVIVKHNSEYPFHPVVVMAFDAEGKPLPKDKLVKVDLSNNHAFKIRKFTGEDISYIYNKECAGEKIERKSCDNLFSLLFP